MVAFTEAELDRLHVTPHVLAQFLRALVELNRAPDAVARGMSRHDEAAATDDFPRVGP
jgi:hypothetical protein